MIRSCVLSLAAIGLLADAGRSEDKARKPLGPVPRFLIVWDVQLKTKELSVSEYRPAELIVKKKVVTTIDGKEIESTRDMVVTVHEYVMVRYPLEKAEIHTADGDKLTVAEAIERLESGSRFILSADGNKVDPAYLNLFRRDMVVLVVPVKKP